MTRRGREHRRGEETIRPGEPPRSNAPFPRHRLGAASSLAVRCSRIVPVMPKPSARRAPPPRALARPPRALAPTPRALAHARAGRDRIVGLVPAAGSATRLGSLPCSKEVLPLPARSTGEGSAAVRPAIAHLLEAYEHAGVERAIVVVRSGKWDVPGTVLELSCGVDVAYVVVDETPSPVHSLACAAPFLQDAVVALGFPDILFTPKDAYEGVLARLEGGNADVVLGLFPTDRCEKADMVVLAEEPGSDAASVRDLVIKQPDRGLRYTWAIAAWRPRFTEVLSKAAAAAPNAALHIGEVIRAAITRRLRVEAVPFDDGEVLDIGTPEDLRRAMAREW